ncbi:MAG: GNAT family N-acetyltransferase [bacterium]
MIEKVRMIKFNEIEQLLELYKHLHVNDPKIEIDETLKKLWKEIFEDPNHFCLVIEENGKIISSCNLIIIRNLTRNACPYALIENVVTHKNYRKKGYGTAILKRAIEIAKEKNCYKVMLMTSRKDENTLRFYGNAGFEKGVKTGFVKYFID